MFDTIRSKRIWRFFPIVISLSLTVILIFFILKRPDTDIVFLTKRLVFPILRLLILVSFTLAVSAFFEAKGWSERVGMVFMSITRLGNFKGEIAVAFATAFFSGVAANTMLLNAYKEKRLSRKEMFLSNLLNSGLPSFFIHLPITAGILLPFVKMAGIIYIFLMFMAALVRTVLVILLGRIFLYHPGNFHSPCGSPSSTGKDFWNILSRYLSSRLLRIAFYTIPIYSMVVCLEKYNFFLWLRRWAAGLIGPEILPVEGMTVVVFSLTVEFTAGAIAAGAMLESGMLTIKDTVTALLFGNVVATPIRALRHQLPTYIGIFDIRNGMALLFFVQILRIASVVTVFLFYYFLY